jgi:Nod factor-specific ABC transporter NodJ protein
MRGFYTVFSRDMLSLRRRFVKHVLAGMVNPLILLLALGLGLGRGVKVGGMSYLEFIVPGIIALSGMTSSFSAVGVALNISRRYTKTIEVLLTAPVSPLAVSLGKVLAGMMRGLLASAIILVLAFSFGVKLSIPPLAVGIILLNCFLFASMGLYIGLTLWSHEDMSNFTTMVLLPMAFFGGTFFPLDTLPSAISAALQILPLTHVSLSLRAAMLGLEIPIASLLLIPIYGAVFLYLGVRAFKKGDLT